MENSQICLKKPTVIEKSEPEQRHTRASNNRVMKSFRNQTKLGPGPAERPELQSQKLFLVHTMNS